LKIFEFAEENELSVIALFKGLKKYKATKKWFISLNYEKSIDLCSYDD
jgi:hypothetical protein